VLWLLVVPLCAAIALSVGISEHRLLGTIFSVMWIVVVPLGALGVSPWLGILFPYHPMALRRRWALRRPWGHMVVRWLLLITAPTWSYRSHGRHHRAHGSCCGH